MRRMTFSVKLPVSCCCTYRYASSSTRVLIRRTSSTEVLDTPFWVNSEKAALSRLCFFSSFCCARMDNRVISLSNVSLSIRIHPADCKRIGRNYEK